MKFHVPHKEQDMDYRELANSAHHAPQQLSRAQAKARSLLNVTDTKVKSQPAFKTKDEKRKNYTSKKVYKFLEQNRRALLVQTKPQKSL